MALNKVKLSQHLSFSNAADKNKIKNKPIETGKYKNERERDKQKIKILNLLPKNSLKIINKYYSLMFLNMKRHQR